MHIIRPLLIVLVFISLVGGGQGVAAGGPATTRTAEVSITYVARYVYGGRLDNSKAAFARLQEWLATGPFAKRRTYSFIYDVLENSMLSEQGFVDTAYGFGYGACGAPSLLNQLVNTAKYFDSDGTEKRVFEVRLWNRERNPTYGAFGAAIFVDPEGERESDYRWRLNPEYEGTPPEITITFEETSDKSAIVTMKMVYSDEIAAPDKPKKPRSTSKITPPQSMFGGQLPDGAK